MRSRDDIGNHLLVRMAQMRLTVDVIDGGGDVKPFAHADGSLADRRAKGKPGTAGSDPVFERRRVCQTNVSAPAIAPASHRTNTAVVGLSPRRTSRCEKWFVSPT